MIFIRECNIYIYIYICIMITHRWEGDQRADEDEEQATQKNGEQVGPGARASAAHVRFRAGESSRKRTLTRVLILGGFLNDL